MNGSDNESKNHSKKMNRLVPDLENITLKPERITDADAMIRKNEIGNLITQMIMSTHRRGRPKKSEG